MTDGLRADFAAVRPVAFASMLTPRQADGDRPGRRAYLSRIHRRRFASLKAAAEAVDVLPEEEGEAVHIIMSGFFDLAHLLIVVLDRLRSPCECLRVGTLSLSRRNVRELVALYDQGKVRKLDLLCSHFFSKYEDEIHAELLQEFHARGQRVAVARSHAKVITIALEDGCRYVLEGSANLRTCKNLEQLTIARDAGLYGWLDAWLCDMMDAHEVTREQADERGGPPTG